MKIYIVCCNDGMESAWLDEGSANAEADRLKADYKPNQPWKYGYNPFFHVKEVPLFIQSDANGALVLSRFVSQNIVIEPLIGDPIVVQLVEIRGSNKARIGVKAQKGVRVNRQEVYEARQREKAREAAITQRGQAGPSVH